MGNVNGALAGQPQVGLTAGDAKYSLTQLADGRLRALPSPPAPAAARSLNCETANNGGIVCQGLQLECAQTASGLLCQVDQYNAMGQKVSSAAAAPAPVATAAVAGAVAGAAAGQAAAQQVVQPQGIFPAQSAAAQPQTVVYENNNWNWFWGLIILIIIIIIIVWIVRAQKKRQAKVVAVEQPVTV